MFSVVKVLFHYYGVALFGHWVPGKPGCPTDKRYHTPTCLFWYYYIHIYIYFVYLDHEIARRIGRPFVSQTKNLEHVSTEEPD